MNNTLQALNALLLMILIVVVIFQDDIQRYKEARRTIYAIEQIQEMADELRRK